MPVEVQRKLTVLGYPGVGKSSLTTCFVENRFVENYDPTIENTFHKTIRFRNAHFVTDIVDTAGMVRLKPSTNFKTSSLYRQRYWEK
jgi:Ras family protein